MESDEIISLKIKINQNPYDYNSHLSLIEVCKKQNNVAGLRKARHEMSQYFPLSEDLWLEWINDEISTNPDDVEFIIELFEKSVSDYLSVRIWLAYCQFVMDNIKDRDDVEKVREIFDRAILAAGLHPSEGSSIWNGYRNFEAELLKTYEMMAVGDQISEQINEQTQRVYALYKRQISIPLIGMEATMDEYENFIDDREIEDDEIVLQSYNNALQTLEKILKFEASIAESNSPHLEQYLSYIEFEKHLSEPSRLIVLYERAVAHNPLNGELWTDYARYLSTELNDDSKAMLLITRAIRNTPWFQPLWILYLMSSEKSGADLESLKKIFKSSIQCGFSSAALYEDIYLFHAGQYIRKIKTFELADPLTSELLTLLDESTEFIRSYFSDEIESICRVLLFKAHFLIEKCQNTSEWLETWQRILKIRNNDSCLWMEYLTILCTKVNDEGLCRHNFSRALQTNIEHISPILSLYQRFEYSCNSDDLDRMRKIQSCRDKSAKASLKHTQNVLNSLVENNSTDKVETKKNKLDSHSKRKIPFTDEIGSKTKIRKDVRFRSISDEVVEVEKSNSNLEDHEIREKIHDQDNSYESKEKNARTVFLSNLLFATTEEEILETFRGCGEITDVRLIRNANGRSKGYCYLEFTDMNSVKSALNMDRVMLNGRPVLVSPCVGKHEKSREFRFPTSLTKSILYVGNLPIDITIEQMNEIFSVHGNLKEVRIVTNRLGKSKGFAYVEYSNEESAKKALLAEDNKIILGKMISINYSCPPERKEKRSEESFQIPSDHHHQPTDRKSVSRLDMIPRSRAVKTLTKPVDISGDSINSTLLSNDDFRNLLKKK